MNSQKIENQLNLSLSVSEEERKKSQELNTGFDEAEREWELIIKYSGSLVEVEEVTVSVQELLNEYAIVTIKESQIERLAEFPQIEYIEKPKRLFFQIQNGKRVSCIPPVQNREPFLTGKGVLIGIVDSGIDFTLPDFKNPDGTSRIRYLWDQFLDIEYTSDEIDQNSGQIRSTDISGHGTAVAGIAAGSGNFKGVAPESELIIVKMAAAREDGFPRTTQLLRGIDYVIRKALELQMPAAINISFGNTYGDHRGTSLVERYIDDVSNIWKNCICIGMGNEATSAGHTSGTLQDDAEEIIELAVQERQTSFSVQLWKEYTDEVEIYLVSPSGVRVGPVQEILNSQQFIIDRTKLLLYYGEPSPYSTTQEIYMDFVPQEDYVNAGVWRIVMIPRRIVNGNYEMWLPAEAALNQGTAFLSPKDSATVTIPATASRAISVGAYNALDFSYADFSGRGYTNGNPFFQKPDLVAPGVDVTTVAAGGGLTTVSGTSFATPFVTGSAALLMEWGIVRGNDPYLYGEKIKAYLRRGARPLPGFTQYPNALTGYGALCVEESLPL